MFAHGNRLVLAIHDSSPFAELQAWCIWRGLTHSTEKSLVARKWTGYLYLTWHVHAHFCLASILWVMCVMSRTRRFSKQWRKKMFLDGGADLPKERRRYCGILFLILWVWFFSGGGGGGAGAPQPASYASAKHVTLKEPGDVAGF